MTSIRSLKSLTLGLPPSCIQFCPAAPECFVIGTYFLHPKEGEDTKNDGDKGDSGEAQKRSGSLIVYRLEGDDGITHITTLPRPSYSILDIEWSPHVGQGDILAVATSTGLLEFFCFIPPSSDSGGILKQISSERICEESTLVLSLAWHPTWENLIGLTLSDGRICLRRVTGGENPVVQLQIFQQHSLEAWCMAFVPSSLSSPTTTMLSGGDDALLISSSVNGPNQGEPSTLLWQDRKTHSAGITAILPLTDELVVTGSYDDHVRLIFTPQVSRRQVLAEENLGGGVWRLKVLGREGEGADLRSLTLLASCMHAGTCVLQLQRTVPPSSLASTWSFELLARFEEHESMNYGSDVFPSPSPTTNQHQVKSVTVLSTSFYDKLLCLWRVELPGPGAEGRIDR